MTGPSEMFLRKVPMTISEIDYMIWAELAIDVDD
jgi:hypothetical protein